MAGVAIAGMLVTGIMSLIGISGLKTTRTDELNRAVPYITALHDAELAAKAAANDERGFLIAGDKSFAAEALGRKETVDERLAAARALGTPAEQATIDEIKAGTDAWFAALDAEFKSYAANPKAAIDASFGANRDLRKAYEGQLAAETDRADAALLAGEEFDATVQKTRTTVIVAMCVAFLLSVLLALWVARMIITPLRRVSAVLDAVADGDLSKDPEVDQKDELGGMARSLRQAIANLRTTITDLAAHSQNLNTAA
nr:hypothetical protein GCM10020092_101950 [Actinoplanes digitatis]